MAKRLRNNQLIIRVSDTEREMIKRRMEMCKEINMTRYMRRMAIDRCIFVVDYSAIKEMTYELHKIGVNINQIAHKINSTGTIYEKEINDVKEMLDTIWQFQKMILSDELNLR